MNNTSESTRITAESVNDIGSRPPKHETLLHIGMCLCMIMLWLTSYILAITPNNRLHANGFGNAIMLDLLLGIPFAFFIAICSFFKRRTCPYRMIFFVTQFLAWGHSVGLIAFLTIAMIYALRHGA